jgi:hypothetical protein
VLPAGFYILLQSNIVQTYLGQKVSKVLSDRYHTEIFIGKVDIKFFLNVELKDVYIADNHKNTLLKSGRIHVNLRDYDLKTNYFAIKELELENTYFNLHRYKKDEKLNIENFISLFVTDTTSKGKPTEYPLKIKVDKLKFFNSGFSFISDNYPHNNNHVIDFNDIGIDKLNIEMEHVAVLGDSVSANIKSLSLRERCGFTLSRFSGNAVISKRNIIVNNLKIKTPNSNLDLDLKFAYNDFNDFADFLNIVKIKSDIRKSALNFLDIAYFTQELTGMDDKILISTNNVKGTINNLKVNNFKLQYRNFTSLDADVSMNGLPNIEETFINLNIRKLTSSVADLNQIIIPNGNNKTTHLDVPKILQRLGKVNLKGKFTGFYSNFVAYSSINTDIGAASTDIIVSNSGGKISYNGKVNTAGLDVGQFTESTNIVGKMSIDAQIIGSGLTAKTASFKVNGIMNLLEFNKYSYTGIVIDGGLDKMVYTGRINVNDKNLKFNFNGTVDLSDTVPGYNFKAKIMYANLYKLNLLTKDSISEFIGNLRMNFTGKNIDQLEGTVSIDSAEISQNDRTFSLKSLSLETHTNSIGYRTLDLKSDYIDAIFKGFFVFRELPNSFERFVLFYLPKFNFHPDTTNSVVARQEFDFNIKLYNASPVMSFFIPHSRLSGNSTITGNFNSIANTSVIHAYSSEIDVYGKKLINYKIDFDANAKNFTLGLVADSMKISDSLWMANFGINTFERNDTLNTRISWDNKGRIYRNNADLNLFTYFINNDQTIIGFRPSQMVLNDSLWTINPKGTITFDTTRITFHDVRFSNNKQYINIDGDISKIPQEVLAVQFTDFNVSNLDFLTNSQDFDLDGIINGRFNASDLYGTPAYYADMKIKDFGFNHDKLGDALILSKWDAQKKGIEIKSEIVYTGSIGSSKPLLVSGYYYPTSKKQNFDLTIDVDNLRIKTLSRYIESFGSIINGTAVGKIRLTGTNKEPDLEGNLKLYRTFVHINYINTTYSLAYDSLKITKNAFVFNNVILYDQPYNDTAVLNGTITHKNFKNLNIDISIYPKKIFCLNTNSSLNELFYGKAFATGEVHIYGPPENINLDIVAKTEKGTQLFIPVGGTSDLSENNYITFVSQKQDSSANIEQGKVLTGITMDMIVNATDDAEIQLQLSGRNGDRIKGKGNGAIRIRLTPDNDFNLYGDYSITSGDYLFTFQNIVNKKFNIDQGSTIKFNGDPYEAILDITARYKLKANLGSLGVQSSDSNRNVQTECILKISNALSHPEFSFFIDFPNMTDYEKGPYLSVLNQNLNNNFITLLIINRFYGPGSGIGGNTLGGGAGLLGESASQILSNLLSQITDKVGIGVNYRPGQNLSQEEVAVALSTQLFNEKVIIESNLGVNTGQNINNKSTNQIVGDVNLEFKLNNALRLKVFNRTNDYDIWQYISPYTQGIGIVYRKEFNNAKDLFRKKNNKK